MPFKGVDIMDVKKEILEVHNTTPYRSASNGYMPVYVPIRIK